MNRVVHCNIGLKALTREHFIKRHVTGFANILYNDNPNDPRSIRVANGSYSVYPYQWQFLIFRNTGGVF